MEVIEIHSCGFSEGAYGDGFPARKEKLIDLSGKQLATKQ